LEGAAEPDLPLLSQLKQRGATDFLAEVIQTGASFPPGVSWATRQAGGFSEPDAALLKALTPYLGLAFGSIAEHRKTDAVLRTYLGTGPGREVLEGRTRRGDVRRLNAAVLLTDLRGFTAKTETWSEAQLLAALNQYFEIVADAVTAFGGEVLKFMGDSVLSVFRSKARGRRRSAAVVAAAALDRARAGLEVANRGSAASLAEPLDFVAVLHVGALSYGNIGARDRLDFTVVGPAVNIASRIESFGESAG
jgi:adenylate cyclase